MAEIALLTPMFAGVSYEKLEGYTARCNGRLRWTAAINLYSTPKRVFLPGRKARLFPLSWQEAPEQPDAEFDLHLNNGRLLEHFHEGNLTYRTTGVREKTPDTFVEVSPALAEERSIQTGTWVHTHFALRASSSACRSYRPSSWQRTLHADELSRESNQSLD